MFLFPCLLFDIETLRRKTIEVIDFFTALLSTNNGYLPPEPTVGSEIIQALAIILAIILWFDC